MEETTEPLLIKRYASRRLYNTETSDYITLQEIAGYIRAGRDVKIVDLKTGEDLTSQFLLQIIAELGSKGEHVLPLNVLMEVVRSYNNQARDVVPQFLNASFEMFKENQALMTKNFKSMANPVSAIEGLQRSQQDFFAKLMGNWPGGERPGDKPESSAEEETQSGELDAIKRQLADLQSKIDNL